MRSRGAVERMADRKARITPRNAPARPVIALISDLHSNLEALTKALDSIQHHRADSILCLGDVLGYGASPIEVVRAVEQNCALCLRGNHDAAFLDDRDMRGFNERAAGAVNWTRERLQDEPDDIDGLYNFLGDLTPSQTWTLPATGEEILLVHGSPLQPLTEYLMPSLSRQPERLAANFAAFSQRLCFCGHTHHPGIFLEGEPFRTSAELDNRVRLEPNQRAIINVGSVGQPRDGDLRLCYALFDGEEVRWERIDYNVQRAAALIQAEEGLHESLGTRLLLGR